MMKLPKLTAVIEPGEDGWYVANCPELGIVSQGETPEHAEEMIKADVRGHYMTDHLLCVRPARRRSPRRPKADHAAFFFAIAFLLDVTPGNSTSRAVASVAPF